MELELSGFHEVGKKDQPRRFLKNNNKVHGQSLLERNDKLQRKRTAVHLDKDDPDKILFYPSTKPKICELTSAKVCTPETKIIPKAAKNNTEQADNFKPAKTPPPEETEEDCYDRFCFTCGYVNNCSDACFSKDDQGNLVNNFCIEF